MYIPGVRSNVAIASIAVAPTELTVTIDAPAEATVPDTLLLSSYVEVCGSALTAVTSGSSKFLFAWSMTSDSGRTAESLGLSYADLSRRALRIPRGQLPVGEKVVFKFGAVDADYTRNRRLGSGGWVYATAPVSIVPVPPIAAIGGGSLQKVDPRKLVSLDGTASSDPNGRNVGLDYSWKCRGAAPTLPNRSTTPLSGACRTSSGADLDLTGRGHDGVLRLEDGLLPTEWRSSDLQITYHDHTSHLTWSSSL